MEALIEELAAAEHTRWAHWQRYVHQQCKRLDDGSLVIPPHLVRRWEDQIERPYDQLSEAEKASDREQVQRVLPILARFFPLKLNERQP
jgi:hypothetical protein